MEHCQDRHQVIHLSVDQLLRYTDDTLSECCIVIDEVDSCVLNQRGILKKSKNGALKFKYLAKKLSKAAICCGVSGSIPEHAEYYIRNVMEPTASARDSNNN